MHSEISGLLIKFDDMQKDFTKKSSNFALTKDIIQINQALETKANLFDINEALNSKASKESVITALQRKANKNEFEAILNNKANLEQIQNINNILNNKTDIIDFEKIFSILDAKADKLDFSNLLNNLENKAELKDFHLLNNFCQEIKNDYSKRVDVLDQDIDRLIENIKNEFGNMKNLLNNLDMNKLDFKEFEKISSGLARKDDLDILNSSSIQIKNDIYEIFSNYKNDIFQNRKIFDEQIFEKIKHLEKNLNMSLEEDIKNKEKINEFLESGKNAKEENSKITKYLINNSNKEIIIDINSLKSEFKNIRNEIQDLINRKIEKNEFELIKNKIYEILGKKVNFFLKKRSISKISKSYIVIIKQIS